MDLTTVVTISSLLLIQIASNTIRSTTVVPSKQEALTTTDPNSTCSCSTTRAPDCPPHPTSSSPTLLGVFTVQWQGKSCTGDVFFLSVLSSSNSSRVCHDSVGDVEGVLGMVCERTKGCTGTPRWGGGPETLEGLTVHDRGLKAAGCKTLRVFCTVQQEPPVVPDVRGELKSYKTVTGLLCFILLVLLLIRFTRPTVTALQNRLSDRRQSRWIGPTQSQSVSYHRGGKGALQNDDGDKRLQTSYPALDRLTVSTSREPSSNRNSEHNC